MVMCGGRGVDKKYVGEGKGEEVGEEGEEGMGMG